MARKKVVKNPRSWQENLVRGLALLVVGACVYFALFDPWDKSFDPPESVDVALFRIGHGFKAMVGAVEEGVQETNESMQNTVDGRNDLNDSRIDRDRGGK